MPPIIIAPSLSSADFARLGEEIRAMDAAGADRVKAMTAPRAAASGATAIVAGSSIFGARDYKSAIAAIRAGTVAAKVEP